MPIACCRTWPVLRRTACGVRRAHIVETSAAGAGDSLRRSNNMAETIENRAYARGPYPAYGRGRSRRGPHLDWSAAIWAGVIAGLVFVMAEMLLVWLVMGQSPWGPPRMIAAMVLGEGVLQPPADFSTSAVMTAMMIHLPLSAVYGAVIAGLIGRRSMGAALLIGMIAGLVIYGVNFYLVAPAVFPWFIEARNWIGALTHAMFGLVAGGAYVGLRRAWSPPATA
jgi:hypothetical protein